MKTLFTFLFFIFINTICFANFETNLINEENNYIDQDILQDDSFIKTSADKNLADQIQDELMMFQNEKKESQPLEKANNQEITDEVNLSKSAISRSPAIEPGQLNENEIDLNFKPIKQRRVRSR